MGNRLYETCLRGIVPDGNDLLSKNDIVKLKRCIFAQAHANLPPITTHNIQVSFGSCCVIDPLETVHPVLNRMMPLTP